MQVCRDSAPVICAGVGTASLVVMNSILERLQKKIKLSNITPIALNAGNSMLNSAQPYVMPVVKVVVGVLVGGYVVYSICNCFYRSYTASHSKSAPKLTNPSKSAPPFRFHPDLDFQKEEDLFDFQRLIADNIVNSPKILSPRKKADKDKLLKAIDERKELSTVVSLILATIEENPDVLGDQEEMDEILTECNKYFKQQGKKPVEWDQLAEAFKELVKEQDQLLEKVLQAEVDDLEAEVDDLESLKLDLRKHGLKLAGS